MKVISQERLENGLLKFTLQVEPEEFDRDLNRIYAKERGKFTVPGFRRGRAPRRLLENLYGKNLFYSDAINDNIAEYYLQALEELHLQEVTAPEFKLLNASAEEGYSVEVQVAAIQPPVLKEYRGLKAPCYAPEVTDEVVDQLVQTYVDRATRTLTVDREAAMGDVVVLDYTGLVDGQAFEGGSAENVQVVLGSGRQIPGFEEQLVGAKADEDREIHVTFPENYWDKNMAGKDAVFETRIHAVQERQIPELDDEFAKDVSEFDTLAEFRESLAREETERRKSSARAQFEDMILAQLVHDTQMDIPQVLVDQEIPLAVNQFRQEAELAARMYGCKPEDVMAVEGADPEHLEQFLAPEVENRIRTRLVLDAVAVQENLIATTEELEEEYSAYAAQTQQDVEKVKENVSASIMAQEVLRRKARQLVVDSAVPMTPEDYRAEATSAPLPEEDQAGAESPEAAPAAEGEGASEGEHPEPPADSGEEAVPPPEGGEECAPGEQQAGEVPPETPAPAAAEEFHAFEAPAAE